MQLQVPFVQLPLHFDAELLLREVDALGPAAWREHPQKYPGNFALPLISVDGDPGSDAIDGPMRPTEHLRQCPCLRQVLARVGAVWGRTRLMKLEGGAEVTPHADINYYWRDRVRVHVPIKTRPEVRFICGDAEVNMAAGECWIFDTWRPHRVINPVAHERIHLVADTVGSEAFWDLVEQGHAPGRGAPSGWHMQAFAGGEDDNAAAALLLESTNVPLVMTPWELRNHIQFILDNVEPQPQLAAVQRRATRFMFDWRALWARYGEDREGWPAYRSALDEFAADAEPHAAGLRLVNGMGFISTLRSMVLGVALADHRAHPVPDEALASTATGKESSP